MFATLKTDSTRELNPLGIQIISEGITAEERKAALTVTQTFYAEVLKNSNLRVPKNPQINVSNKFEFASDGVVHFPLTYGAKTASVETQAGIYHELGHSIFLANTKTADGKFHLDVIHELNKQRRDLKDQLRHLETELKDLGINWNDDELMKAVARKKEEINELRSSIKSLDFKLDQTFRSSEQYQELVADLFSITATKNPNSMVAHMEKKYSGNPRFEKALPYYNQRGLASTHSEVIYFEGRNRVEDDPYTSLQSVRRHLYKNYFSNPAYQGKEYKILEKVIEACQLELNQARKGYKEMNLGLISRIDELMGQHNEIPNMENLKFINGVELMK